MLLYSRSKKGDGLYRIYEFCRSGAPEGLLIKAGFEFGTSRGEIKIYLQSARVRCTSRQIRRQLRSE